MHIRAQCCVDVEWDPRKAASNRTKHGVVFADAVHVLFDPEALTLNDEHLEEERFVTIGRDCLGRVLVVVFTYRGENVRLISARRATKRERAQYEG